MLPHVTTEAPASRAGGEPSLADRNPFREGSHSAGRAGRLASDCGSKACGPTCSARSKQLVRSDSLEGDRLKGGGLRPGTLDSITATGGRPMTVEFQINDSVDPKARYLTWMPSACTIRLTDASGAGKPVVTAKLTGKSAASGGAIVFR